MESYSSPIGLRKNINRCFPQLSVSHMFLGLTKGHEFYLLSNMIASVAVLCAFWLFIRREKEHIVSTGGNFLLAVASVAWQIDIKKYLLEKHLDIRPINHFHSTKIFLLMNTKYYWKFWNIDIGKVPIHAFNMISSMHLIKSITTLLSFIPQWCR